LIPDAFQPVLLILAGISTVIGGYLAFKRLQQADVKGILDGAWGEKQKGLMEEMTKVVEASFTGRAEADAHFRAEMSANYKTVLREALEDHSQDERRYIDTLRDKITEYHAVSLQAVNDAKRVAIHVSDEYHRLQQRLSELETEIRKVQAEFSQFLARQGVVSTPLPFPPPRPPPPFPPQPGATAEIIYGSDGKPEGLP
jgi:hypothetical protein